MASVTLRGERSYVLGAPRPDLGAGQCFDAVCADDQRRVVVKRLPGGGPEARERFLASTRPLRTMSSSRVVRVLDAGWDDGPFLALEPVQAPTLAQWAHRVTASGTVVPLSTVRRIAEELCLAVETAHRLGPLLHGMLSAQSVLLLDERPESLRLKVLDFGLWPAAPSALAAALASPTADPRAPELLTRPDGLTAACDQFSLGVLFAALLTLPAPLPEGPGWGQLLLTRPDALDARLRALRDDLRGGVREALARGLHPDPGARFKSVEDFREALLAADWRPAEYVAPTQIAGAHRDRPLEDFERVWGPAWKERARQVVLPSGLHGEAAAPRSTVRAPTQPAARAPTRDEGAQVPAVTPKLPWRPPTPAAARAARDEADATWISPPKPKAPARAPVRPGQDTLIDDGGATLADDGGATLADDGGATLADVHAQTDTSLSEGTIAWRPPTRRVVEEATMAAGAWGDAGDATLVSNPAQDEGETIAMPKGAGGGRRAADAAPEQTLPMLGSPPGPTQGAPPVEARAKPGAWDGARVDATLPMDEQERAAIVARPPEVVAEPPPSGRREVVWAAMIVLASVLVVLAVVFR